MYSISKQFGFSASHILDGLGEGHPCARLHGHNYLVTVYLRSERLDRNGFVVDYHRLKMVKDYLNENLDHRHLNDIFSFHPTSENIAKHIYEEFKGKLPELYAVEVSETPKTSAVYEPGE